MSALDIKLLRDVVRLWAQVLAIALVIGGGVATLVLAVGSHRSLEETRRAYYERFGFADVFALVKRAPKALVDQITQIPGVAAVDARIAKLALLDVPGFSEPASGQFVSLPDVGEAMLNRLYIRTGRLPEPGRAEEVVVNESFAQAHGFTPGARFSAILNGRKRELVIVGTALSPEFIYTVGPGDLMPDDRRYGIVWMSEKALASAYDLDGAFASVSVKLQRGASEREVISRLDSLLDGYGGQAAYGRKDQTSHAWLDHELDMLNNMSRTLPPIFLLVSAFLVNLTLSRLVALEREQIGLMKALGYRDSAIVFHYLKFVALIVLIGIVIGSIVGTWLGSRVTALFGDFFHFPFLVFARAPDLYVIAGAQLGGLHGAQWSRSSDLKGSSAELTIRPRSSVPERFHSLLQLGSGGIIALRIVEARQQRVAVGANCKKQRAELIMQFAREVPSFLLFKNDQASKQTGILGAKFRQGRCEVVQFPAALSDFRGAFAKQAHIIIARPQLR
jgi:putative ABC transport system permease protein